MESKNNAPDFLTKTVTETVLRNCKESVGLGLICERLRQTKVRESLSFVKLKTN